MIESFIKYINEIQMLSDLVCNIGKVSAFVGVLIFTLILLFLVKRLIVPVLNKIFLILANTTDALTQEDIQPMITPLLTLVKLFGLELALSIVLKHEYISVAFYSAKIFVLVQVVYILIDIILNLYAQWAKKKNTLRKQLLALVVKVTKVLIFIIAALFILKRAGIDITGFIASLGIGGLAIAMASKDTIANFFGSLKIIFDDSFAQGDWIVVGDVEGTVVELGFVSTKIRTFDNAMISLPNATLANDSVKNYNKRKIGRRIKLSIGLTYDAKQEQLKQAIEDIRTMLIDHPGIADRDSCTISKRKNPALVELNDKDGIKTTLLVYLDELADSSINILVYAFSTTVLWSEWLETKQDVLFKIMQIVEKNNLEFAYPTQSLILQQGKK